MSFGDNLKFYRKLNRYSQKQLASELGIALSTYGKYETNEYQPKFDTLINICKKLDVSPNILLDFEIPNLSLKDLGIEVVSNTDTFTELSLNTYSLNTKYFNENIVFRINNKLYDDLIRFVNENTKEATNNYIFDIRRRYAFEYLLSIVKYVEFDNPKNDVIKYIQAVCNLDNIESIS